MEIMVINKLININIFKKLKFLQQKIAYRILSKKQQLSKILNYNK